ncbi:tyrosine-protein phosphatase [Phytoactinopolyspora alkaliphila]|uniref:Tyrosine-protein phosphatase n=1 Tax=Phytoactinopolyspora alkaliphila TaxID=1783498 RepID=A0A6N9YH03_9ACTN|nr:tyrosine-protein phosphatase [Phytoactinopolyspora alkaliphila]NED94244.1 tyrosine-protein phosphatase [Phytoactinopolyspora alkaliphila]
MRHLPFAGLRNFRDLGGYPAAGGRTVAWKRLYRSDALCVLDGDDWARFVELGVGTVIDLRFPSEVEQHGRVPQHDSLSYHHVSIQRHGYEQTGLDASVDPAEFFAERYTELATDGAAEIVSVLEIIAASPQPVVFHCAAGKDRTGIVAAVLLSLLGVSDDDVAADYALTDLIAHEFVADWRADPRNPPQLWPGYGRAPEKAMRGFLAAMADTHGSMPEFVRTGGVDDAKLVSALRERYLD